MKIDFRDPEFPTFLSPPPPPQLLQTYFSPDISPQTSPFFTGNGLKTYIYSCARPSEHMFKTF